MGRVADPGWSSPGSGSDPRQTIVSASADRGAEPAPVPTFKKEHGSGSDLIKFTLNFRR